jgi:outer membrane protein
MKKALMIALVIAMAGGSVIAQAYEQGDWIIRLGATTVDPDTDSDDIKLPGDEIGIPGAITLKADVDDDTQLGIIPVYMVTNTFGVEILLATPFEHDITAHGQGAIKGLNLDAGSTKQLPPTVSVQWYPRGGQSGWQPYIGAGVNWTIFFDEDVDNELKDTLGALIPGVNGADLSLDDSFGLAAQAGVDIPFGENWAINLAVWYIDIETTAKINAKVDGTSVAKVKFDVDLDPWVYNIGIAYKF